jgi:SprT protein
MRELDETGQGQEAPVQLTLGFADEVAEAGEAHQDSARRRAPEREDGVLNENVLPEPEARLSAAALRRLCQEWLVALDLPGAASLVEVVWNARLRSTAGYASYPAWRVELNPRLHEFDGQVERTLKHELAHLIAYHRAGRRRIEPHGKEWRAACVALGIPDEKVCHQLPLPRSRPVRKLAYHCPACGFVLRRVRRFRRATACLSCCNQHAKGAFDSRFKFVLRGDEGGGEAAS